MAEPDARFEEHRNEALRLLGIALDDDASASDCARRNLIAAAQVDCRTRPGCCVFLADTNADELTASVVVDELPVGWTDAAEPDASVTMAAGDGLSD
jgi:hypothetical protein